MRYSCRTLPPSQSAYINLGQIYEVHDRSKLCYDGMTHRWMSATVPVSVFSNLIFFVRG